MIVFLCGLPRVGKTACGLAASKQLGRPFIDLDVELEAKYFHATGKKKSCREIYAEEGPASFRQWEQDTLLSLEKKQTAIVSLGGGTLESEDNKRWIHQNGYLIYLKCCPKIAFKRMGKETPAFLDPERPYESFIELAERRLAIYESSCDAVIDVQSLTIEDVASRIERSLSHGSK